MRATSLVVITAVVLAIQASVSQAAEPTKSHQLSSSKTGGSPDHKIVSAADRDSRRLPVEITKSGHVAVTVEHSPSLSLTIAARPGPRGTTTASAVVTSEAANYLSVTTKFDDAFGASTQAPGTNENLVETRDVLSIMPDRAGRGAEIQEPGLGLEVGCAGGPASAGSVLLYRAAEMSQSAVVLGSGHEKSHGYRSTHAVTFSGTGGDNPGSTTITYVATTNY